MSRSRVEFSISAPGLGFGMSVGIGKELDLDQKVGDDHVLRDFVKPEWFEPVDPEE